MRNIWTIFKTDVKNLSKCFFAMVVVLAISVLPSLYAWLNIYSNWDPYGNTGNISIAVASLDQGSTDRDGNYVNKGEDVVADLREATSINWVIVDTEEQAKEGVYSGDYYAAVVIDRDFTDKMFHMLTEWDGKPSITYDENAKKNAVATKITDTAVDTLKRSISRNYLEVVIGDAMHQANLISVELSDQDPEGAVSGILYQARDLLVGSREMLDAFSNAASGDRLISDADVERLSEIVESINVSAPDSGKLVSTAAQIQQNVFSALDKTERALDLASKATGDSSRLAQAQKAAAEAADRLGSVSKQLNDWADQIDGKYPNLTQVPLVRQLAEECTQLQKWLNNFAVQPDMSSTISDGYALIASIRTTAGKLTPTAKELGAELDAVVGEISDTLQGMDTLSADAEKIQNVLKNTSAAAGQTSDLLRPSLNSMITAVTQVLDKVENPDGDDAMDVLLEVLGGSPEAYGAYFPEMVQTTVTKIYPIENYGSAMAPFYTVLAIWVGAVIMVSILKPHAKEEGLENPKPWQLFFGRYIMFFLVGQVQAAVIVTGDLFLLKIQCLHPGLMYLAAAVTALTFSLLIYTLAMSFGDMGKAAVVVVMVLQIAGSSGTFPIELLPTIYQKIYRFFPFPYAIDAIRECICGTYGHYYYTQLGFLLLFAVAALVVGLLIRRPFMGLNEFVEEKLEETEMF